MMDSSYQLRIGRFMGLNSSRIHCRLAKKFRVIEMSLLESSHCALSFLSSWFLSSGSGADHMFLFIFVIVVGHVHWPSVVWNPVFYQNIPSLYGRVLSVNFSLDMVFHVTCNTLCYPTNKTICYPFWECSSCPPCFMTRGFLCSPTVFVCIARAMCSLSYRLGSSTIVFYILICTYLLLLSYGNGLVWGIPRVICKRVFHGETEKKYRSSK